MSGKLRAAEAAVAAGAVPKPNGQPPTAYPIWDGERGCWVDDAGKERPSTIPATVQPEQQPEPQPMMEQPPSQPRTPYAHTYTLGRVMPRVAHEWMRTLLQWMRMAAPHRSQSRAAYRACTGNGIPSRCAEVLRCHARTAFVSALWFVPSELRCVHGDSSCPMSGVRCAVARPYPHACPCVAMCPCRSVKAALSHFVHCRFKSSLLS